MKTKYLRKFRAQYTYDFKDDTVYFMHIKTRHAFIKYTVAETSLFVASKYCSINVVFARMDKITKRLARLQYYHAIR